MSPDRDHADSIVLVADVGGTFVRCALTRAGQLIGEPVRLEGAHFDDLGAACRAFLATQRSVPSLAGASIAAAGRVRDGRIDMTNARWHIAPDALSRDLAVPVQGITLLNDFEALAWGATQLGTDDTQALPGGARRGSMREPPVPDPRGHRALLGPGSGLGVAALIRTAPPGTDASAPSVRAQGSPARAPDARASAWLPVATEGGHASFAPETPFEREVARLGAARFGRTSWERVLSGPGLVLLHEAALRHAGQHEAAGADAQAVLKACASGQPAARLAVDSFLGLLGAFAGDLALLYQASAGVLIAGGVLGHVAQVADLAPVRTRFEAKGRFSGWLEEIPLDQVVTPHLALLGAARAWEQARA
jgi:glucokinase